ncbi:hypothetical protein ABZ478_19815 [Streptomyces sp. NPDC005706]|uniref:hypothetical protein n=1 Tax=Streptomyces sp. NPDC005706 TaxID=3157169 RepID=UPI0033DF20FF
MGELVGEDDQDEADDTLHQPGGGGHAPVTVNDDLTPYLSGDAVKKYPHPANIPDFA